MEDEWLETLLGEVIELKRGYDLPKQRRTLGAIPVISSSGISDWHAESKIKGPGVITGRYGTIGEVFYSEGDFWPLNTSLYVKDFKNNDPEFIYYFLKTINFFEYSDKAAVPGVNRNHLHMASVRIPRSIGTQKKIAGILRAFDKKVELNRKTNQTLESMAQALFKSWFVDFDPVIDNALAAGHEIPEPLAAKATARRALQEQGTDKAIQPHALPNDIRQLFPSRFQFTEKLGWIPEGWNAVRCGDVIELAYGKSLSAKHRVAGNVPVYGSSGVTGFHNKALIPGPGIVVGRKGTVGSIYWEREPFFPIDTVFYVKSRINAPLYWLYQYIRTLGIKSLGADSAVPGVNRNAVYALSFLVPEIETLNAYWSHVESNLARREQLSREAITLRKIRDTLLPKLLSGELRTSEAEKTLDEALA